MSEYTDRLDEILENTGIGWEGYRAAILDLNRQLLADDYHPGRCINHEKYTGACCGCQRAKAVTDYKTLLRWEMGGQDGA